MTKEFIPSLVAFFDFLLYPFVLLFPIVDGVGIWQVFDGTTASHDHCVDHYQFHAQIF